MMDKKNAKLLFNKIKNEHVEDFGKPSIPSLGPGCQQARLAALSQRLEKPSLYTGCNL